MKYWLIVFLLTPEGEFIGKREYPTANKAACYEQAAAVAKKYVNQQTAIELFCVTDDHYQGRKQDPGIPYD